MVGTRALERIRLVGEHPKVLALSKEMSDEETNVNDKGV